MINFSFQVLFHILNNEQVLLKRTDQKASTLMSTLGIFMVFFIVHYKNIPMTMPILAMIYLYFAAAFVTILSLLRVLTPRLKNAQIQDIGKKMPNPTYFAGISQFGTPEEYRKYLMEFTQNETETFNLFADNLYAVGQINAQKLKFFNIGMKAFATAIFFELVVIISMYIMNVQMMGIDPVSGN